MATTYTEVLSQEQNGIRRPEPKAGQGSEDKENRSFLDAPSLPTPVNFDSSLKHAQSEDHLTSRNIVYSVDEAIELLGMGRFQLFILIAAGLCFAADAMQVLLLTFLSNVLRSEWDLKDDETALITSILFVGAIFGTITLGPLADRKGRKPVFLLAASIISVFGVAVAMVTSYLGLLGNLFMVGWGVGGLTVPFDILAEFLPRHARGKNLLVIEYFWTVGVLFVVGVASYTLGDGHETSNWRLFVTICVIPCWLSVMIGFLYVPESPRWLCAQGRGEEALEILRIAASRNGHNVELLFPDGVRLNDEAKEVSNPCELFSPQWRSTTLQLWGAWGCFAFGYYGTVMAITEIFDADKDSSSSGEGGSNVFDYSAIFVSNSAELVGTTIAIFSIDTLGRIPLQVLSYAIAGVLVCSLYFAAAYECNRTVLVTFGFGARIFEMIGSCVSWVSTAEILTTDIRTTGHSAASAVARIGSLFSPFLIEGHSSLIKKGLVMLLVHAGTVYFTSQLPETKGSRMGLLQDHTIERDESNDENFSDENVVNDIPHVDER